MAFLVSFNIIICLAVMSYNYIYLKQKKYINHFIVPVTIAINGLFTFFMIREINFITITFTMMLVTWASFHSWIQLKYKPTRFYNQQFVLYIITITFSTSLIIVNIDAKENVYQSMPYLGVSLFILGILITYLSLFNEPIFYEGKRLAKTYQKGIYKYFIHPKLVGEFLIIISFICMIILTPHWFLLVPIFLFYMIFILLQNLFF